MPEAKLVHSSSDDYGNILVFDYPRYRALSFDSVFEQSAFSLEKPYALIHEYTRAMMLVLAFIEPRHITLLGLGGGSLLRSLHHYLSRCHFHVVELRQKVYEIARDYFDIPESNRVCVTIEDAQSQLQSLAAETTDIVFADMYDAYHMSPMQAQQQFIRDCWRILSPRGWLVINYHRLPETNSEFFECLTDYFSVVMLFSGDCGNHILFASKSHLVDYAQALKKLKHMESILGEKFTPLYHRLKRPSR